MLGRNLALPTLVAGLALPLSGCFLFGEPTPTATFDRQDVSLETPAGGFRALGEKGEVMQLADDVAVDTNRWVAEIAASFGELLEELNANPPTDEDGKWRIYGPEDAEGGENASWMVRVSGDEHEAHFEVLVGERGAKASQMVQLFAGDLVVDDKSRRGGFSIDFDVIAKFDALGDGLEEGETFGGKIAVEFSRALDSKSKTVDIDFENFYYVNEKSDEHFDYEQETYAYHRESDGAGVFHFATWAPFDEEGWSGPELERVTVDMAWDAREAGRARARVLEVEGQGDLRLGDVVLHECFDPGYALTWADLNEPYAAESPDYNEGDAAACVLKEAALDGFEP